jgi:hypothetical protein
MQRVTLVTYETKPERAAENEALSLAVFEELRARSPGDVAYGLFKSPDGLTFVHLFVNFAEDDSAAVTELPSFKAYQAGVLDRCVTPPQAMRFGLNLMDSYGLKGAPVPA